MADFTDVANAMRDTIAAALYPSGIGSPSSVGFGVQIYQGWPEPEKLDQDLKAGIAHVTVWPTDTEKPLPRAFFDWQTLSIAAATLTAALVGSVVTIGGTVSTPQTVAVIADGLAFAYAVQVGDTLNSIAAALAAGLTAAGITATAVGPAVTLTSAKTIVARVGGQGVSFRELRRQERVFQVSCWAGNFTNRDALAKAVDVALGAVSHVLLADGTNANIAYRGARQRDEMQKQLLYRRDILYCAEFSTIQTEADAQILVDTLNTQGAAIVDASVAVRTTNF